MISEQSYLPARSSKQQAATSKAVRIIEAAIFTPFGWFPLGIGQSLRRLVYRPLFGQLGRLVRIQPGVIFIGGKQIHLDNYVQLSRGVCLRSINHKSSIFISENVMIDRGVDIKASYDNIEIGKHTHIGPYTCISGGKIVIGDDCLIASHCGIYANNHTFSDALVKIREQKSSFKGIFIEEDCWLGSGVRVVDGVTIGKGSVIGAGAVVTKNIPPYSVAVGVPAKVISTRGSDKKRLHE
ncbi:MAG: acyltransferase [Cyanobacteria bacterium J06623_4]